MRPAHLSLLLVITAFTVSPPAAAETSPEDWGKYRQAAMEVMKGHISAISLVAFGKVDDTGYLQNHADGLAAAAAELGAIFPPGSGEGTGSLDSIWSEPEKFAAAVKEAQDSAAALQSAVASGERGAIAGAFRGAGGSCKGCHEDFRAEE